MVSGSISRDLQLSPDAYIRIAETCDKQPVEKPEGSGKYVRAKRCCFCNRVVCLGAGTSNYSLQQHMISYQCQQVQKSLTDRNEDLLSLARRSEPSHTEPGAQTLVLHPQLSSVIMHHSTPDKLQVCPGAVVDYGLSIFSHYPWHLHDTDLLEYELAYVDPKGRFIRIRSNKCNHSSSRVGAACDACNQVVLGRQFQELWKRAHPDSLLAPTLNIQFRTYPQVCSLLAGKKVQMNGLKFQKLTAQKRIQSLSGCMDHQKQLMFAIAQSDDGLVGRIIKTALQNGAGVDTMIDRIVRAHQGLFRPHSYSEKSVDLVALVLMASGPRLAHAVAAAMHLPSISTVRHRLHFHRLLPSIGFPTEEEVLTNIESSFQPDSGLSNHSLEAGLSLMIDEIAVEPRLRYSIHQDAVVGLCREHASSTDIERLSTRGDALDALLKTKTQLDSGACHRATELTMAAIARFDRSEYNPAVILASGTCKTGKALDQLRLISLMLETWDKSPNGKAIHGKIWSVCTDGDAGRRLALFQLCMSSRVPENSDLFRIVGHLPLLNLLCGPSMITHDGDYKHEEKRLASALRSRSGITINGSHITPKMLVHNLRYLDDLQESRILSFFDGRDPQNVPKANALLMHLFLASQLPILASRVDTKPFILLGEVLGSFIRPYTVPTMSLTEQVASLAKCGHLLYALYRIDGSKFLPGQLIYDIQASIKNAVFCIAKTQLIDPTLPFYLLQTGTDRLESRFGTYRTCSSDRNGDTLQMTQRAGAAQFIDKTLSTHQSWNRTPYRLSLDGRSGVDHTNPASWIGDVVVGHVDLRSCWLHGRSQAAEVLKRAGVPFEFDLAVLSTDSLEIDLMRPTGQYPGIQVDNLELDLPPVPLEELVDNATEVESEAVANNPPDSTCNRPAFSGSSQSNDIDVEHLLPPVPGDSAQGDTKRGWIEVDNKPIHLESAVRYLLGSDGGAKSTDRLRRVCGYTRYLHSANSQANSVLGDDFHVSELVATFLCVNNQLALAVIRVTEITADDGRSLESISDKHFADPNITLSGQLLELEYESDFWYWTQRYDLAVSTTAAAHRKRRLGFDFASRFALPINPSLVDHNGERVWGFNQTQLHSLAEELWALCANNSPEDHIQVCEPSALFPYRKNNLTVLFHQEGSAYMQRMARPTRAPCFQCGEHLDIKNKMRVHVGKHILSSRINSSSTSHDNMSILSRCGFCGRAGTCLTTVEQKPGSTRSFQIASNCPYRDKFPFNDKLRPSKSHPCTNRPVECPHCPSNRTFIWSYDIHDHIRVSHGPQALNASNNLIKNSEPSDDELRLLIDRGVGSTRTPQSGKRKLESDASTPPSTELTLNKRQRI